MNGVIRFVEQTILKHLGLFCVLGVCGLLVLGLEPFHRPKNRVSWMKGENGAMLTDPSTIWSSGSFEFAATADDVESSLEVWLIPAQVSDSTTLLAFSTAKDPLQFWLQQFYSQLILKREPRNGPVGVIGIDDVFRKGRPVFVTITSGKKQSAIYVDGVLARAFPGFRLGKDFSGQLVFGTSPVDDNSWPGQLRGLAIYSSELTATQVARHFQSWTTQGQPAIFGEERPVAVYLMNERAGDVIHNAIQPGVNLQIPERYELVHQYFLQPFWKEYKTTESYWWDLVENVVGFIPLGFACGLYWSSVRPFRHPAVATVTLGFAISLTIEVLQSVLPTRNSGTMDLFTNTFGTYLGYLLYRSKPAQVQLTRILREAKAGVRPDGARPVR